MKHKDKKFTQKIYENMHEKKTISSKMSLKNHLLKNEKSVIKTHSQIYPTNWHCMLLVYF